jgi:hypothetical protein
MATIVTRAGKGSELTHAELDANFTNLAADVATLNDLHWWNEQRGGFHAPWTGTAIASGTNNTALPSVRPSYMPGGVFIRSNTTINGGYRYNASLFSSFGTLSQKMTCQFMWLTSFTGRIGLIGWQQATTSIDPATNYVAGFYQNGDQLVGRCWNGANKIDTSAYTLSLSTPYTFHIDCAADRSAVRFRVYAGSTMAQVFDQSITNGIYIVDNPLAARPFAGFTEASTTASDIGLLYTLGLGTVEGYERARGRL